tara:strand:+ start:87283 stop:87693 length:411 start_codon:yes stop_codon:yes gene_type:complete
MKEQIKTIQIIHLALTLGLVLAYYFLAEIDSLEDLIIFPAIDKNSIVYLLIPFVAYIFSNFMFKNMLSKIDTKLKIEENLGAYQTASLVRWAILEGAAFIIITNKPDFILFGVLLIVYLAILRPSENNITSHLKNL